VAPSAVPSQRYKTEPRALSPAELRELIDGYAEAARFAREGGLDGVEISMAHGYLLPQFYDADTNRRTDAYNGDRDARLGFGRELIAAVRDAAGDGVAVGIRLAADPKTFDPAAVEECAAVTAGLGETGGLDFVSFALGNSATYAASTWIVPPLPAPRKALPDALSVVRVAAGPLPVIAATGVVDLDEAEKLLGAGLADAVGMTRALVADPDLLLKEDGEHGPLIECIGCNQACIGHYHAEVPIGCVVNPRTGRERTLSLPVRLGPRRPLVLVVGAGPAGAAAAIEAASAGARVTVIERDDEIGGQLRLAGLAPGHTEVWTRYLRSTRARLDHADVELCLGEGADADRIERCDIAVIATGARPFDPRLPPPPDPATAVTGWEAIARPEALRGPALVADWGGEWSGLDAAERIASTGSQTRLACAATHPGEALHQYQRNLYLARLDALGVEIIHHTEVVAPRGRLVMRNIFSGRESELPAIATLVLASGRVPADELWAEVGEMAHVVRAGDVLGPRTAEEAILEGTLAVREMLTERSSGRVEDGAAAGGP
jgi:NADPH-dependent 2,4-dienoyl-CoA reductase/sulfur reductase-like enzyme